MIIRVLHETKDYQNDKGYDSQIRQRINTKISRKKGNPQENQYRPKLKEKQQIMYVYNIQYGKRPMYPMNTICFLTSHLTVAKKLSRKVQHSLTHYKETKMRTI